MKKKTVIIIVIAVFIVLGLALSFARMYNSPFRADEVFEEDYEELVMVVEYMKSLEDVTSAHFKSSDKILIAVYDGELIVRDVEVTDENILDTMKQLTKSGYKTISKSGNTIYFDRWRNLFGRNIGFAFTTDNTGELDVQFVIKQRELSEKDWYYYISDYEEWRTMN